MKLYRSGYKYFITITFYAVRDKMSVKLPSPKYIPKP